MDNKRLPHYALTLRLKPSIGNMLEDTANKMGVSKTAVVALAIRDIARREGIEVREETEERETAT